MHNKKLLAAVLAFVLAAITAFAMPLASFAGSYADEEGYVNANGVAGAEEVEVTKADIEKMIKLNYSFSKDIKDAEYIAKAAKQVENGATVTYKTAPELSAFVQLGYKLHLGYITKGDGSLSITKGYITQGGKKTEVYVVAMSGTDFLQVAEDQSTGVITDLLSGFNFNNPYVRNIKKAVLKNVPTGSNVMFTGHSLGGMVAQQCAAEPELKAKYNVVNTLAFGSPLLGLSGWLGVKDLREGTVKRLGDTKDPVPYLSVNTLNARIIQQFGGLNRENGKYKAYQPITAHCTSYQRPDVWGKYDALGFKKGKATLTLDFSTTQFFETKFLLH